MKVAAIQMCSTPHVDDNLEQAEKLIHTAAMQQADLVVLPEMFAILGASDVARSETKEVFGHGKIQNFLNEQAKKYRLWLIGGTIPIACNSHDKIRAASLVINPEGLCVGRYDKMHLYDADISETESYRESRITEPGETTVVVATPLGKIGLSVCYDVRFPELFRSLVDKGAEIFTLPSAFTRQTGEAHWELLARARAVENACYVIGACQGGQNVSTRSTYGHSLIIDPWGRIIAQKNDDTRGVIVASIDLNEVYRIRRAIPALQHRRI